MYYNNPYNFTNNATGLNAQIPQIYDIVVNPIPIYLNILKNQENSESPCDSLNSQNGNLFGQQELNHLNIDKFSLRRDQEKLYKKVGEDNYQCKHRGCLKYFTTSQKIKKHVKSHILRKKIVCQVQGCDKKFSSLNNLKV